MKRRRAGPAPVDESRRALLKTAALGGAAAWGLPGARRAGAGEGGPAPRAEPATPADGAPAGGLFSRDERRALAALADHVLPGAGDWGAVDYLEGLLTCLDGPVPRVHAGPVGAGDDWLPLDRVRAVAWRLRIEGSDAVEVPEGLLEEPVRGLRPLLREGAREAARAFASGRSARRVWWGMPAEFRDPFTELVLEGSLGDPFYGGNRGGAAWRAFHFEGALLGYGTHSPRHADPADPQAAAGGDPGPDPLGPVTRAVLWALGFFSRRIA